MGRVVGPAPDGAGFAGCFELALVFVVVAIEAQQLPVAAIGRVVVMIVVAVMHRKLAHVGAGKLAAAATADPGVDLERLLPIPLFAFAPAAAVLGQNAVELAAVAACHGRLFRPAHPAASSSVLAAMMKSFWCRPFIFLVCQLILAQPQPKLISGWWPSVSAKAPILSTKSRASLKFLKRKLRSIARPSSANSQPGTRA